MHRLVFSLVSFQCWSNHSVFVWSTYYTLRYSTLYKIYCSHWYYFRLSILRWVDYLTYQARARHKLKALKQCKRGNSKWNQNWHDLQSLFDAKPCYRRRLLKKQYLISLPRNIQNIISRAFFREVAIRRTYVLLQEVTFRNF